VRGLEGLPAKNDILIVRDQLSVGFARPFEIVASAHVVSECAQGRDLGHGGALCFMFVVHGRLDLDVEGRQLTLASDEVFLLAPTRFQRVVISHGTDAEFFVVQFRRHGPAQGAPQRSLEVPDHVALGNPGRLKSLVRMFMEETRRYGGSPLVLHHLLVLMLCEMTRASHLRSESEVREDNLESVASRVDAYIAAHYHESIGTPDIAAELRYNPDYLERAYRAERHLSIREAIHARRIREARAQLLLQSSLGIAQIAALCGYADTGYFRRVFKRATSMTPHGYRVTHAPDRPAVRTALPV
jgi:AraC-like DNA-binding protein